MKLSMIRRRVVALAMGFSAVLFVNPSARAEESNFVRVEHNRPDGAIVGERVSVSVKIFTDTWLSKAATITVPEVPGLILLKVSSFGINGTERIGSVTYTTQIHEFAVFARRSGRYVIPPFRLRFGVAGQSVGTPVQVDLETAPIELVAELPPGAEGVEGLIATTDLSVVETWDPMPEGEASVGDAIRRSINYSAQGVMGMAFPPTRFVPVDGLGVYPQPPELDDRTQRGNFLGSRTDAVTYVFERPGTFVLPAFDVQWWDLDSDTLRQESLPSRTVVVVGAVSPGAEVVARGRAPVSRWIIASLAAIVVIGAGLLIRPVRFWLVGVWRGWQSTWRERRIFRQAAAACRGEDAVKAYRALRAWHGLIAPGVPPTMSVRKMEDPQLEHAVRALERQALIGDAGMDSWSGLAEAMPSWRRLLLMTDPGGKEETLPALNPSGPSSVI